MEALTSSTWVPLGAVVTAALLLIGFVRWLESMHSTGKTNSQKLNQTDVDIKKLRDKIDELEKTHSTVSDRLARLETKLEELPNIIKAVVGDLFKEHLNK